MYYHIRKMPRMHLGTSNGLHFACLSVICIISVQLASRDESMRPKA